MSNSLKTLGFRPVVVAEPQKALAMARKTTPSIFFLNLPRRIIEPSLLQELFEHGHSLLVLAHPGTPPETFPSKNGRLYVLPRPLKDADLQAALRGALDNAHPPPAARETPKPQQYLREYVPLLGGSQAMRAIREIIEQIADTNTTVLIRGESGAGKELVARAIHHASPRHAQPFVKVNCAALPGELLESELLGHEKGAFTGAYRRKLGKFEFANQGTLFLDEIGELPLALQAKLLHVLQDNEFSRVGGREVIRVDARVIASTNRNLETALAAGQFREDLYYRLNVVEIQVPPLRERRDEIPLLADYFLDKFRRQYKREVKLSPETMKYFTEYPWPGNVRELENLVRRVVVLGNVRQIQEEILARLGAAQGTPAQPTPAGPPPPHALQMGLREIARRAAREAERRAILEILEQVRWKRTEAARLLKISYKTLLSKITECGLAPKQQRPPP